MTRQTRGHHSWLNQPNDFIRGGRISVPYTDPASNRPNAISQAQFSQQSSPKELLARIGKRPFDWQAIGMTVQILPELNRLLPPEIGAVDSVIQALRNSAAKLEMVRDTAHCAGPTLSASGGMVITFFFELSVTSAEKKWVF
jgi:hypothetical protein